MSPLIELLIKLLAQLLKRSQTAGKSRHRPTSMDRYIEGLITGLLIAIIFMIFSFMLYHKIP